MITAILPAMNDEVGLAMTLSALVPAATDGVIREAIVVDEGATDGVLRVADAAGCTVMSGHDGDGLRRAALAARGEWLLFLRPAAVPDLIWQSEVLAFIDQAALAGKARERAAVLRLGRAEPGWRARRAEWAAAVRSRLLSLPHDEQGLLLSREFYAALGGHRPLGAMAGTDLARRIGRRRLTLLRARAFVRTPPDAEPPTLRDSTVNAVRLAMVALRLPPRLIARLGA